MENIILVSKHTFTLFVSSLKLPFLCNLQCETWSEFLLTQFLLQQKKALLKAPVLEVLEFVALFLQNVEELPMKTALI